MPRPIPLRTLALLAPLLALGAPASRAAGAPTLPQDAKAFDVDLGDEVDASLRWLRAQQKADGSYGGVSETAWALYALATSPRHYTRRDGPFVRKALDALAARQDPDTGAIHDADAEEQEVLEQSVMAALALQEFDDEQSRAVLAALRGGIRELPSNPGNQARLERDEAELLATRWLAKRRPDRSWEGDEGAVIETSRAVADLSRAWAVLKPKSQPAGAATALPPFGAADRAATLDALRKGALFLVATSEDGKWGGPDAGLTAMALNGLLALPAPRPEPIQKTIDQGLRWLASLQHEDGSIHDGKLANYITSASILALSASGKDEYRPAIERARRFLMTLQSDEGEGYTDGDMFYGGIGYGSDERPDLSNLQMALEALAASGSEKGDETFLKALKFLERSQNRSESNDVRIVEGDSVITSGDDGGGVYYPGDSKAGFEELPDGTKIPRSYGSMTYALLRGFVFAGLPKDDPRMQAAWKWIREHYTLDVNPGFERSGDPRAPYQGLFYYFHSMAKTLDLYGEEEIVDAEGVAHPWRKELAGRLIAMQRKDDGSWTNENSPRWWEGNPVLATAYAMTTLGAALPPADASDAR